MVDALLRIEKEKNGKEKEHSLEAKRTEKPCSSGDTELNAEDPCSSAGATESKLL